MEKERLNPTVVYVLSIIGLLCCCLGGIGVFLAGPAYLVAQNGLKRVSIDPESYDHESVKAMETAKMVALIITVICAATLLYNIYDLSTGGWERRQEMIEEFMKGYREGMKDAS